MPLATGVVRRTHHVVVQIVKLRDDPTVLNHYQLLPGWLGYASTARAAAALGAPLPKGALGGDGPGRLTLGEGPPAPMAPLAGWGNQPPTDPQSGERFRGRETIAAQRGGHPADRHFTILRITGDANVWVSECVITYDGVPSYR
ncbi:hypothetical protein ACFZDK_34820 [Streptomyces sp. NPDC007901]|uniref:hypothetical protein n=1 Tax=Streptomyces sp. NPDC007901 TaxID=3364785 RepID=UPI0036E0F67D